MWMTVGDVARQLGARSKDISTLFYLGHLDTAECPCVGGRRLIPPGYVQFIESELRQRGKLPETTKGNRMSVKNESHSASSDQGLINSFDSLVGRELDKNRGDRQAAVTAVARREPAIHARFDDATDRQAKRKRAAQLRGK